MGESVMLVAWIGIRSSGEGSEVGFNRLGVRRQKVIWG